MRAILLLKSSVEERLTLAGRVGSPRNDGELIVRLLAARVWEGREQSLPHAGRTLHRRARNAVQLLDRLALPAGLERVLA